MATPSCPKCGHTGFEMKEMRIAYSAFRIMSIQCSSCGCVVGTHEYYNIGETIHKLAKKLGVYNLD